MTQAQKDEAKAFYLKRMEQNKVGDEDLNSYFDKRFGEELRNCDADGKRRRIDIFRLDEKPELVYYIVVLEEIGEDKVREDEDDEFGTFYSDNIHNPLEAEWGSVCGEGEYICRVSLIDFAEINTINPHLGAVLREHHKDLMTVGL